MYVNQSELSDSERGYILFEEMIENDVKVFFFFLRF